MLQHVRADDEVLAGAWYGGEPLDVEVGDHVGLREARCGELGKEGPVLLRPPPVYVGDRLDTRRLFEGDVPGTELNSSTVQVRGETGSSAPIHEPATVAQPPTGSRARAKLLRTRAP